MFDKLRIMVQTFSPGLVFISETKFNGRKAGLVKARLGFDGGIHVDSIGRSGGLILLWRKGVDEEYDPPVRILTLLSPPRMVRHGGLQVLKGNPKKHKDIILGSFFGACEASLHFPGW